MSAPKWFIYTPSLVISSCDVTLLRSINHLQTPDGSRFLIAVEQLHKAHAPIAKENKATKPTTMVKKAVPFY